MPEHENAPIARHAALQPLSRDHYQGLVCAQALIRSADDEAEARQDAVRRLLEAWDAEIADHFADEERLLDGLIAVASQKRLETEHTYLRELIQQAAAVPPQSDPGVELVRHLGEALRDHIRWEERELFNEAERSATPRQLETISDETSRIEASRPRAQCHRPNAK